MSNKRFVKIVSNSSFRELYEQKDLSWEFVTAEDGIDAWTDAYDFEHLWSEISGQQNGEEIITSYFRISCLPTD